VSVGRALKKGSNPEIDLGLRRNEKKTVVRLCKEYAKV
jgi:hypothetical protein